MRNALTINKHTRFDSLVHDSADHLTNFRDEILALRAELARKDTEIAALRLELADARAAMHDGLMTFLVGDGSFGVTRKGGSNV